MAGDSGAGHGWRAELLEAPVLQRVLRRDHVHAPARREHGAHPLQELLEQALVHLGVGRACAGAARPFSPTLLSCI